MSDQQQAEYKIRPDVTVVTPENFSQYVDEKMGITPPQDLEVEAKEELKKLETEAKEKQEEAKEEEDPTHDVPELGEEKKKGINERFSKLTTARKEAEAKAEKAIAEAKEAAERAEKAAKEAEELRNKYEPKKTEQDPKPRPDQFNDINEYSKALEEWTADDTERKLAAKAKEEAEKAEREKIVKSWQQRQDAFRSTAQDYTDVINSSQVGVSNEILDAILESEVGPQILYHLAKNPEVAKELAELSVAKALVRFGRIESSFVDGEKKPVANNKIAEVSKAPAPISPLKGSNTMASNKVDDKGEFHGTYEEWKQLRRAGKIK